MSLVLHVESADPAQAAAGKRRVEVADRLTVGRGPKNDLVLKDSEHVSKYHCVINSDGQGCYTITDMSMNGTVLNFSPEPLPRETAVPLPAGSVLLVGPYTLTVAEITPSHSPSLGGRVAPHRTDQSKSGVAPDDNLFGDPLIHQDVVGIDHPSDSFDMPGGPSASRNSKQDHAHDFEPGRSQAPLIPEDIDLFGDKGSDAQWSVGSHSDHAPSHHMYFDAPKVVREKIPDDWDLSELGVPIDPALAKPLAAPDSIPTGRKQKAGASPPMPRVPRMPSTETEDSAALASFLAATGLAPVSLSGAEKLRVMRETGQILVATVAGLIELLSARATMKEEFRIGRTSVSATSNNPLKFSTSFADAIRLLLIDRPPGFLPGPQSIEEALADLKKHQVALMAGMQATLATVVARFDPATLEKRLEQSSLLEELVPAARKARYWEVFKTCYKEIASELEDDFHRDLGEKFARAYLEQVKRS